MLLVPEAYRNHPELDATFPEVTDFYDYFAGMQEAWDGPALLVFTDGKKLGCRLDRNGLRPARFWRTAMTTSSASRLASSATSSPTPRTSPRVASAPAR